MIGRPETTTQLRPQMPLAELWLKDQSIAFASTLLGTFDPFSDVRTLACARYLIDSFASVPVAMLTDSTLLLLATISNEYHDYFTSEHLENAGLNNFCACPLQLAPLAAVARDELAKRDQIAAGDLNRVLISHAVYLLRRPHLSAQKFLKWMSRAAPKAAPGIKMILANLQRAGSTIGLTVENALAATRNTNAQTRDRLEKVDALHALLLDAAGNQRSQSEAWLTRICIAYRSSLFCWPLLAEGTEEEPDGSEQEATGGQQQKAIRGLSLPISLFVVEDGNSTEPTPRGQNVWMKYKLTRAEEKAGKDEPRFQRAVNSLPARMEGFRFGWSPEWMRAFQTGLDVAKKLWASQNGRLKYADAEAAERKLHASLNVDLRATCDIVESVFETLPPAAWARVSFNNRFFTVGGRSAEAYWVQCVLALLLPASDVPMGVCTGTIDYKDGEFEMGNVAGVAAKLDYANRAGFPRAVVAGDSRDLYSDEPPDEDEQGGEGEDTLESFQPEVAAQACDGAPDETDPVKAELKTFLECLDEDRSRKTVEVNLARTARAAADAMQPAGWRRTDFLRTPAFQRKFSRTQRRLFIHDALRDRQQAQRLKRSEIDEYRRKPWRMYEEDRLRALDHILSSRTGRTVVHLKSADIERTYPGLTVEEALGKWAAWKDNQVRTRDRSPGLGVMTLRSEKGDTETRLWAALAEMLDADESWWERFQWVDLPSAADKLAQLLCNQKADPSISLGSAPDLLIVFDDAGFTTHRTNTIFPTEFHHQFIDLLNPRHPSNHKPDHLDAALKRHDHTGRHFGTRIIVVHAEEGQLGSPQQEVELAPADRALLERLSLFRFGCSRAAGYAMANFHLEPVARLNWKDFEKAVRRLIAIRLLSASRADLLVTSRGRQVAGRPKLFEDPRRLALAHRDAALALCPILYPQGARTSSNRDRQLEPANVLEATWHLKQSYILIPWRFRGFWNTNDGIPAVPDSQALLTFLRTSPDWDTVLRLRVNNLTRQDSVELCFELLDAQKTALGREPPSPVVGVTVETLGRLFKNQPQRHASIDDKAHAIITLVDSAVENLKRESLTKSEWERRMRHLLSRQIYALRMLGLPLNDPRMAGARLYIDNAVTEILEPHFLDRLGDGRERLDDFPISQDCWRTLWTDGKDESTPNKTLDRYERSRYAYAAARSNLSRPRPGAWPAPAWDEPWIAYFNLTRPDAVAPKQIAAPLHSWWDIFGKDFNESLAFGRRTLDKERHTGRYKKDGKWLWRENWLADVGDTCANLWHYVTNRDEAERLTGAPVAPALRLINVLAMQETLPAWRFLRSCDWYWLRQWPKLVLTSPGHDWPNPARQSYGFVADEWSSLGSAIIGHEAGWVAMLDNITHLFDDRSRHQQVTNWLRAYREIGCVELKDADPEDLVSRAWGVPLVADFLSARRAAISNAQAILALRSGSGHVLQANDRILLNQVLRILDRDPSEI